MSLHGVRHDRRLTRDLCMQSFWLVLIWTKSLADLSTGKEINRMKYNLCARLTTFKDVKSIQGANRQRNVLVKSNTHINYWH